MPWLWIAPAGFLIIVFLLYPSLDTVRRSLLDARSDAFVGLENYRFIIDNPNPLAADTHSALWNNFLWLLLFTATAVPIGLVLAVLTGRVRYESAAQAAIFIPMAISFVAAAVIWRFIFEFDPEIGTANAVTTKLGVEPTAWLQNTGPPWTFATDAGPDKLPGPLQLNNFVLIFVGVWMWTGFAMVVLSAGLKGVSSEILEAARVDGANEWSIFWRVIVPVLSPTIVVVATTLVIQALKKFDLVWVMTGGRFETDVVATLFFKEAFVIRDFGVGAALAVVLLLWVVPVMVISIRRFQFQAENR
ncbi:MAG: ABC transporter permease subunit [Dehalococcoidia bacterium]|nr:ABC transporter permease subunit [Dehalococcoidia bacterium]